MLTLQDEEKMKEVNEKLEKFLMGSGTKSIRNHLSKGNMIFSEESSRAIHEIGNMELIELRQTTATCSVSCLAWSTYQRDWTCVNAASGFDTIKVRWTESAQHLQR